MVADHQKKEMLVYSHPSPLQEPILMGTLSATVVRGKEIEGVVAGWKTEAEKLNISSREIEQMAPAFLPYIN